MSGTYLPGDNLKGQTEMLGYGYIIKIAKHFNVSTDFLLGETNIPDRKN